MRFYLKRGIWYLVLSLGILVVMLGLLQSLDVFHKAQFQDGEDHLYRVQGVLHGQWKQPKPRSSNDNLLKNRNQDRKWVRDDKGLHIFFERDDPEEWKKESEEDEEGAEGVQQERANKRTLREKRLEGDQIEKENKKNETQHHKTSSLRIWPDPSRPWEDRIISQLEYVPDTYNRASNPPLKKIFLPGGSSDPMGQEYFKQFQCPVDSCYLTDKTSESEEADAVLFGLEGFFPKKRPPNQIWILYLLESPLNTGPFDALTNQINWTATYRRDSTFVTPYEKFVYHKNATSVLLGPSKNFAEKKTKLVAWFVSNCGARNQRLEFVEELRKHVQVDIYGYCGNMSCPRYSSKCSKILSKEYKFYLSFENSNCQDYITEKFYQNALW